MSTPNRPMAAYATSFDSIATEYAAARPSYPPELFETLQDRTGIALAHSEVLDVGAGTGIASQRMNSLGARVVGVEPGPRMADQFAIMLPGLSVVRGDGNALPFADHTFHLVTYAQSWHWTEPSRSIAEAVRVVRPGGALALWWNVPDRSVPWIDTQQRRLTEALGAQHHRYDTSQHADAMLRSLGLGLQPEVHEFVWNRDVPHATHLNNLATHSAIAVQKQTEAGPVLDTEGAAIAAEFPEGPVREQYICRLTLASVSVG